MSGNINIKPGLFGINQSNRDFTKDEAWGKNQFNTSFPAALACYMDYKKINPVYLTLDENLKVTHKKIQLMELFGIKCDSPNLFFAFESDFAPYRKMVIGKLPRADLVTQDSSTDLCLRSIEIKLTALPDNATYDSSQDEYGCELVIRPDTVVYLALSIASDYINRREDLLGFFSGTCPKIHKWASINEVLPFVQELAEIIDEISLEHVNSQKPLVMQPVWKTIGKSLQLHESCLDVFVWSDLAFTRLFVDITKSLADSETIKRPMRTTVWLAKMLHDFAENGNFNHEKIIDEMSYNTKNDKAFAANGSITHPYMSCPELTSPRIKKSEIKNMIIGGGQKYLSPERRFDAAILSTPGLFDNN